MKKLNTDWTKKSGKNMRELNSFHQERQVPKAVALSQKIAGGGQASKKRVTGTLGGRISSRTDFRRACSPGGWWRGSALVQAPLGGEKIVEEEALKARRVHRFLFVGCEKRGGQKEPAKNRTRKEEGPCQKVKNIVWGGWLLCVWAVFAKKKSGS